MKAYIYKIGVIIIIFLLNSCNSITNNKKYKFPEHISLEKYAFLNIDSLRNSQYNRISGDSVKEIKTLFGLYVANKITQNRKIIDTTFLTRFGNKSKKLTSNSRPFESSMLNFKEKTSSINFISKFCDVENTEETEWFFEIDKVVKSKKSIEMFNLRSKDIKYQKLDTEYIGNTFKFLIDLLEKKYGNYNYRTDNYSGVTYYWIIDQNIISVNMKEFDYKGAYDNGTLINYKTWITYCKYLSINYENIILYKKNDDLEKKRVLLEQRQKRKEQSEFKKNKDLTREKLMDSLINKL